MPVNPEMGKHMRMDQAELDAAVQRGLLDLSRPDDDTGFFSLTEGPEWLDIGYVGMDEGEAVAAERDGIAEVRVVRLSLRSAFRLDHKPERLNLVIIEGRVIRAAFF
jgi:hypothetical protein